jgi:very-short-patch-repair endonuclease
MKKNLQENNIVFEFQYQIGRFVCDFAIPNLKIVIECDGDYWHSNPLIYNLDSLDNRQIKKLELDKRKDLYLLENGWEILRFYETDIKRDIKECISIIKKKIKEFKKVKSPLD